MAFYGGASLQGLWFMTHFTVPRNILKVGWPDAQNTQRRRAIFAAWGPLTKTSAFDFTYGRYDERKGVFAAYDYCSYNC
jgi:hypothetical protein